VFPDSPVTESELLTDAHETVKAAFQFAASVAPVLSEKKTVIVAEPPDVPVPLDWILDVLTVKGWVHDTEELAAEGDWVPAANPDNPELAPEIDETDLIH
jgi:hypothetical protein